MNSLARTLAKRLITQKCEYRGGDAPFGWSADAHEVYAFDKLVLQTENEKRADKCYAELIIKAEAVIREAIDKTRDATVEQLTCIRNHYNCAEDCCIVAIRSFKQSNSGMEAADV